MISACCFTVFIGLKFLFACVSYIYVLYELRSGRRKCVLAYAVRVLSRRVEHFFHKFGALGDWSMTGVILYDTKLFRYK